MRIATGGGKFPESVHTLFAQRSAFRIQQVYPRWTIHKNTINNGEEIKYGQILMVHSSSDISFIFSVQHSNKT